MICPNTSPPNVLNANATSPKQIIASVPTVRNLSAAIVEPTESARNIVTMFISSFCAVLLRRSVTPHSRSRFPNINVPTRGTHAGRMSPETTVQMIGNNIFSRCETGRSCPIMMPLSFLLVMA